MTVWHAIVLGVVQGLTEFLPISSTAHLRILPALVGWPDPGAAFTAVIQLGTLAAVLIYFDRDIIAITRATITGLVQGRPFADHNSRLGWMIALGTVPIVIFGLLFKESVETSLRSLYVISGALIGIAGILILAEVFIRKRRQRGHKDRELGDLSWADAVIVGLAQSVALIPGSSRSGCTIAGGLFRGLSRETAARFSFLLSLPAITMAGIFEFFSQRHALLSSGTNTVSLLVATVVSAVVGYLSIAFLLNYLKRHTMWLFIIYRLVLGGLLLGLLYGGRLSP